MVSAPTVSSFQLLLNRLHGDADRASEKYEELRVRITKILHWKGCPESEADDLADVVLDRLGEKLLRGESIDNVNAFAAGVVRFVWMERCRTRREDAAGDDLPDIAVDPQISLLFDQKDERVRCLKKCLNEISASAEDRRLIVEYYDPQPGKKNKDHRKRLCESLGLSASALKVRAFRLRTKLETCINECVRRVTEAGGNHTTLRGVK